MCLCVLLINNISLHVIRIMNYVALPVHGLPPPSPRLLRCLLLIHHSLLAGHHGVRPVGFRIYYFASSVFAPFSRIIAANRDPGHFSWSRMDGVRKCSWEYCKLSSLGEYPIGVLKRWKGSPRIRKAESTSIGRDFQVERPS